MQGRLCEAQNVILELENHIHNLNMELDKAKVMPGPVNHLFGQNPEDVIRNLNQKNFDLENKVNHLTKENTRLTTELRGILKARRGAAVNESPSFTIDPSTPPPRRLLPTGELIRTPYNKNLPTTPDKTPQGGRHFNIPTLPTADGSMSVKNRLSISTTPKLANQERYSVAEALK